MYNIISLSVNIRLLKKALTLIKVDFLLKKANH